MSKKQLFRKKLRFENVKRMRVLPMELFRAFSKRPCALINPTVGLCVQLTNFPSHFIENLTLPFDKSKDNTHARFLIPLISLLYPLPSLKLTHFILSSLYSALSVVKVYLAFVNRWIFFLFFFFLLLLLQRAFLCIYIFFFNLFKKISNLCMLYFFLLMIYLFSFGYWKKFVGTCFVYFFFCGYILYLYMLCIFSCSSNLLIYDKKSSNPPFSFQVTLDWDLIFKF